MKVVLLAGGFGTRISEESVNRPKPMIEIGGTPILLHIMKYYAFYGHKEFIICGGYRVDFIKKWFLINFKDSIEVIVDNDELLEIRIVPENYHIYIVDTGLNTMTGGRIKRIKKYINNETFLMTYGDGVSDVDLSNLVNFHETNHPIVTITSIQPESRYGVVEMNKKGLVKSFREKSQADSDWINAGFMVIEPTIFDFIDNDETVFEKKPLESICQIGQLMAFRHRGFWRCMDTLRDKNKLEELWAEGNAPWKK